MPAQPHIIHRHIALKSLPVSKIEFTCIIFVEIYTNLKGASALSCKLNYKINRRSPCKMIPIWYMVLLFENDDRQPQTSSVRAVGSGIRSMFHLAEPTCSNKIYINFKILKIGGRYVFSVWCQPKGSVAVPVPNSIIRY